MEHNFSADELKASMKKVVDAKVLDQVLPGDVEACCEKLSTNLATGQNPSRTR